jgi:dephospho-CoA kinase
MIIQIIGQAGAGKTVVVKVFIYYAHERGWNSVKWGRV